MSDARAARSCPMQQPPMYNMHCNETSDDRDFERLYTQRLRRREVARQRERGGERVRGRECFRVAETQRRREAEREAERERERGRKRERL